MVFGSCRVGIIEYDGQSVAWTLRQFDVTLYDGLEYQLLEVAFYFVVDLVCQSQT